MKLQFILKSDINGFLDTLSVDNNIFYLTKDLAYKIFSKNETPETLNIDVIRSSSPIKMFLFTHNEEASASELDAASQKPNIIFGVKSCDLNAIKVLDNVFLSGVVVDPFYERNRQNTLLFGSDCPDPQHMCFCSFIGDGKPYPDKDQKQTYDLNFSTIEEGYIVETGSEAGEKIMEQALAFFKDPSDEQLGQRTAMREQSFKKLDEVNKNYAKIKNADFHNLTKTKFLSESWKDYCKTCVQCTGCNNICPSCYCFYLNEQSKEGHELFEKLRLWDACHYTTHGRTAGGGNSRPKVYERFRNRYQCKLNYRKENFDLYGCTGCGRCFVVSPCKIDIRNVINELMK
ncbi:MAG: 4Fe-4S dicluster domain-containing protein [Elusimicrobia bacterium]|nr:4Fe-4S dicluster domain-containing protein [Elusimicrobiota bacterium]MBU2614421.1 4Fe-4S dicluster domain-containing protein [Elusimicrobiota bacterium]